MAILLGVSGAVPCTRVQAQAAAEATPAPAAPQPQQPPGKTDLEPVAPVPSTQAQVPAPATETLGAAGSPGGPVGAPLTLEQAIAQALDSNEQPRIADQRAAAAEARVDKARSFFFPDVTAQGTYIFRPDPVEAAEGMFGGGSFVIAGQKMHTFNGQIGLNLSLLEPRAFPLYSQAGSERDAAKLQAGEAKRTIAFNVARAYLDVLGFEQVLHAAEQRLALADRILDGAEGRFEAGLSSSNDVTRAQLEVATARRELARGRGEVERTRLTLSYLVGSDVDQPLVPPPALLDSAPPAQNAQSLAKQAQARRKDLAAADKQTAAAEAAADEPLMRWFPSLSLNAQYRASTDQVARGRKDEIVGGLQATWLLWDGGERIADREERVAGVNIADLEARALSRQIAIDVRRALSELELGKSEAREAKTAAEAAKKNSVESYVLYKQGLLPALSAADAALQLFQAEVELVRAQYGVATALLDLRAALGFDPFGREPR